MSVFQLLVALLLTTTTAGFATPSATRRLWLTLYATIDDTKVANTDALLECMSTSPDPQEWADMFGFGSSERAFYALFEGIKKSIPIGLRGKPFVLRRDQVQKAVGVSFGGFFNYQDLERAVNDDFLDAGRGTTDNRKGWKVSFASVYWTLLFPPEN
jgi:hypothetical protein